uniref:Cytochrome c oxidase subunit 2 n=1 Tax=Liopterus haemorrhoidalis TaxID=107794 RepID=A0A191ZRN8_9DYTI|nr:cytochrome c oxidase subunit 2 [Liopterus haemorrhoidalis]
MATWSMMNMMDASSPLMEQLSFFHDHTMLILTMITLIVAYLISSLFFNKYLHRGLLEGQEIEMIWTVLPAIVLVFIALPSLRLLYMLDELTDPDMTLKALGHQWYWSYEYSDFKNLEMDSFMLKPKPLMQWFRLLDVDSRVVLPFTSQIRMMVTASDVLHSWTIPNLGVKLDAAPGRLNQSNIFMNRPGLYYGQCSEICGANHSFMPIVIESTTFEYFLKWLLNRLKQFSN